MRYGYMVHRYNPDPEPAPRKFVLIKHATTAVLDLRRLISSFRGTKIVLLLITLPFLFALLKAGRRRSSQAHLKSQMPKVFDKYGYEAIRQGGNVDMEEANKRNNIQIESYLKLLKKRRKAQVDAKKGVTLIAACKNRTQSLSLSLPSWDEVEGVSEIILVDWGSEEDVLQGITLLDGLLKTGKMSLLRANVADWVLGRAYNLAAQFATGGVLFKVDCDTFVDKGFLGRHRVEEGMFYTVEWGSERTENEQALRGVWMAKKEDFFSIGGYDERIGSYGHEDVDLYARWRQVGLRSEQIDLDSLRHTIAGQLLWAEDTGGSKKVTIRMNEAVVKKATPWKQVFDAGDTMQYDFAYSETTLDLLANVTDSVSDPLQEMSEDERSKLKIDVLQRALHDDFSLPWDILPSLSLADLDYLAEYLDSGTVAHVLVVSLEGTDTVSNVFNLVSALQLGMKVSRPVIVVWNGPGGATIDQSGGAVVRQLYDLEATNEMLSQIPESEVGRKKGWSATTRLIGANQWPCIEELSVCADKYDQAYAAFSVLETFTSQTYNDEHPLPVSFRKHAFISLSNKTIIGDGETRALAYNALVESHIVREEQQKYPEMPSLGIVVERGEGFVAKFAADVRQQHKKALGPEGEGLIPIVGATTHLAVRRKLPAKHIEKEGFCEGDICTIEQLAKELASVLAICRASEVYPAVEPPTQASWVSRKDIAGMMVADLRNLRQKY